MIARVKATGKLLEKVIPIMSVDSKVVMFHEYGTENDYYYYEDLDFSNTIDWEQTHIQAAIAAMQGMLANPAHHKAQVESGEPFGYFYAMNAIMCADVLIAELKERRTNESNS